MKIRGKFWVGGAAFLAAAAALAGVLLFARPGGSYSLAEYRVGNLTCGSCVQKIGKALDALPGVGDVQVSVETGRARVEFDPARVDPARVRDAIVGAGYPAALERTASAADYRSEKEAAGRYVARIGTRLIERAELEDEIARLRKTVPAPQAEGAAPRLQRLVWAELVQRQLWLADAEANGVAVAEEDVAGEMERLRGEGKLTAAVARFGGEENLRREVRERLTVERHLERNVLKGGDPALRQVRLDQRLKQLSALVPVEILDPALKRAVGGAKGGCGGCC